MKNERKGVETSLIKMQFVTTSTGFYKSLISTRVSKKTSIYLGLFK